MDTIFSLGTGAGRSAIAVLRLSGPAVRETLHAVAGATPEPRKARLSLLRDPESGEAIDHGLSLFFPAPHSPTGEDYAEFHLHGGRAIIEAMLAALSRRVGLRSAAPGEFARRGFAHGKLDLSQAEALADLIDAETQAQRRQALRIAGGALRRPVEGWRDALIDALAQLEAELDFSDEGDVSDFDFSALNGRLAPVLAEMDAATAAAPASERLREGYMVMIVGPPNAGKSTLLNALARRDLAIVSPVPGTTRDMIEAYLEVDGLPVTFVDTAGLRDAADDIERIGVDRVLARIENVDLVLWLSAQGEPPPQSACMRAPVLKVATKTDLAAAPVGWLGLSAARGEGIATLLAEVGSRARASLGDGNSALFIRERHRAAVLAARASIASALRDSKDLEFIAEDLRSAARSLGRIVGAVDVEHVLEAIFSRFCIGK